MREIKVVTPSQAKCLQSCLRLGNKQGTAEEQLPSRPPKVGRKVSYVLEHVYPNYHLVQNSKSLRTAATSGGG